jgi:hypothetical protein
MHLGVRENFCKNNSLKSVHQRSRELQFEYLDNSKNCRPVGEIFALEYDGWAVKLTTHLIYCAVARGYRFCYIRISLQKGRLIV